ncbi:hypothetical protein [Cytobacillus sp. BC1816]|uniref:hypothetical protein n=1 Tax=Cytobacillus sp. BC1816 TaxID=3440154 RepID=UPI003F513943
MIIFTLPFSTPPENGIIFTVVADNKGRNEEQNISNKGKQSDKSIVDQGQINPGEEKGNRNQDKAKK